MMDCLIVWASLGPILAFIAGAVVVAWWDDDEDEDPVPKDRQARIHEAVPGVPGRVVSFEPSGRNGSAWDRLPSPAVGYPMRRMTPSCVQCGCRDEWP